MPAAKLSGINNRSVSLVTCHLSTQQLKLRLSESRTNLFVMQSVSNFMKCEALNKR